MNDPRALGRELLNDPGALGREFLNDPGALGSYPYSPTPSPALLANLTQNIL